MRVGCTGATPWGDARFAFYEGGTITPLAMFDGVSQCLGDQIDAAEQYDWYENEYLIRAAVPTDVTITLGGNHLAGATYRAVAKVCLEAGGTGKTARVFIVQVLDHWPTDATYLRNGFKLAAPATDVTLVPGGCEIVVFTFTLDADSLANPDDIRVIAWAQEPLETWPAEVYQTAASGWPLMPDCNANGVLDAEDIAEGTSQDVNSNGVPDECEDCNENGIPDFEDIAAGTSLDCNGNEKPDECDVVDGTSGDCNHNGVPDECDLSQGTSVDTNGNGWPDECECRGDADCNGSVGFEDIKFFAAALGGYHAWEQYHVATYGQPPTCPWENCNANADPEELVTFDDIKPFVTRLGMPCEIF